MDQLKKQFSGRQKSQSPEENAATTKPAAITLNMTASQIQGGASVIAKLTAAVAQQVSVELEYNGYLNRERESVCAPVEGCQLILAVISCFFFFFF